MPRFGTIPLTVVLLVVFAAWLLFGRAGSNVLR
jgi:hypothetical protein